MAPKKREIKENGSILNFFIPRSKWLNNEEPEEEIVVATPSSHARSDGGIGKRAKGNDPALSVSSQQPAAADERVYTPAPSRGRSRKWPSGTNSPSYASPGSSSKSTARRGHRPLKTDSQVMRDHQLGERSSGHSPPTLETYPKPATRYNINPINGAANISPTPDSPYRSLTYPPLKRRIVECVQISGSSSRESPKHMSIVGRNCAISPSTATDTLSKTFDRQQKDQDKPVERELWPRSRPYPSQPSVPATSFSSASTLTSVPASSDTSALPISSTSSSRRVIKGGLKGISNSDSEESSEEELPDVASFYKPKRLPPDAAKDASTLPIKQPLPVSSTRSSAQSRKRKIASSIPVSPPKRYKNSLANLVKDHQRDQVAQASIASLEKELDELRRQEEESREMQLQEAFDPHALLATAGSDSETRDRLAMAMERTEALQSEERFYFFRTGTREFVNTEFPTESLPDEPWSKIYRDEASRKEACISGFAAELAAQFPLPIVVTSWIGEQLQRESNETLCEAYIEIIRNSRAHYTSISNTYASINAIYETRSICESRFSELIPDKLPPGVANMARVACICAPAADSIVPDSLPTWSTTLFLDLALMAVDEHVKKDIHLPQTLTQCIEDLLDSLPEEAFRSLLSTAVRTLFSSGELSRQVQCRVVCTLPASTWRTCEIRKRLALEFFSTVADHKHSDSQDWAASIISCLNTKPEFQVSSSTDYALLKELVMVLDIAVSSGWTKWSKLQRERPVGPFAPPPRPSATEQLHNKQIDLICKCLNAIWSQIKDSGAAHLRRMEAKDAISLLMKRLQYCVRARPKPKKGTFDEKNAVGLNLRQATLTDTSYAQPQAPPEVAKEDEVEVIPVELLSDHEDGILSNASITPDMPCSPPDRLSLA